MAIRRGTTPTLTITAEGIDFTDKTIYITIAQANNGKLTKLTKTYPNADGSVWIEASETASDINVILSQHDTLSFQPGRAEVQIRWIEEDGTAHASDIKAITLTKILLEGVIRYAN